MTEVIRRQDAIRDRDRRASIAFMNAGDQVGDFYAPQDGVYARRGDDTGGAGGRLALALRADDGRVPVGMDGPSVWVS